MRKSLKKIVSAITAGAMALALGVTVIPSVAFAANDPTKEAIALGKKDFDPNGEYNAYVPGRWMLGIQRSVLQEGNRYRQCKLGQDAYYIRCRRS